MFLLERADVVTDSIAKFAMENLSSNAKNQKKVDNTKKRKNRAGIIFPAQLSIRDDYLEFSKNIIELSEENITPYIPPIQRYNWPVS